jgi:integrase
MDDTLFMDVARDWWSRYMLRGNVAYAQESWRRLECEVMPDLGCKPLAEIDAPMILKVLRRVEARGVRAVPYKIKSHISQIMRYGIACGMIHSNPARDLGWALIPKKPIPRAAITDPRQIGRLMRGLDGIKSSKRRCSLKLAVLAFVRPGELCQWEWDEIEWDAATWRIPAVKMKMKRPHIVPLARQSLEILLELRAVTGQGRWLFPSRWDSSRHESGRVLNTALRGLGYGPEVMTAHGVRAMAATTLSELGWASAVIERQLAHVDHNQVRAAYQRSELLPERRKMMQAWADWLDMRYALAILGK